MKRNIAAARHGRGIPLHGQPMTRDDERVANLFPHGEGMLVPVRKTDPDWLALPAPGYYGGTHAYCKCLGIVDEASGEGLLTLLPAFAAGGAGEAAAHGQGRPRGAGDRVFERPGRGRELQRRAGINHEVDLTDAVPWAARVTFRSCVLTASREHKIPTAETPTLPRAFPRRQVPSPTVACRPRRGRPGRATRPRCHQGRADGPPPL